MKSFLSVALLLFAMFMHAADGVFQLQSSVQLYAAPSESSEIFTSLNEGTSVSFHSLENDWVKVDFTQTMEVWTAVCFMKRGIFTDNVIFRTEPSAAATALTLRESLGGKQAEVIGTDNSGYWRKVRLTGKFSGYLSQNELKESLKKRSNFRIRKTPIISTAVGRLLPLEKPVGPATYKLVFKVEQAEYLVAYVIPDKVNLKLWENWMIYLSGESVWMPSIYTPFLKGANIFPAHR